MEGVKAFIAQVHITFNTPLDQLAVLRYQGFLPVCSISSPSHFSSWFSQGRVCLLGFIHAHLTWLSVHSNEWVEAAIKSVGKLCVQRSLVHNGASGAIKICLCIYHP